MVGVFNIANALRLITSEVEYKLYIQVCLVNGGHMVILECIPFSPVHPYIFFKCFKIFNALHVHTRTNATKHMIMLHICTQDNNLFDLL